jgi:hypothetical protein
MIAEAGAIDGIAEGPAPSSAHLAANRAWLRAEHSHRNSAVVEPRVACRMWADATWANRQPPRVSVRPKSMSM